jgi:hypothetical protein
MMAEPVLNHHFAAYLSIGTVQLPGSFDTFSGGTLTLNTESYRPGAMVGTIVIPAPEAIENITLSRYYDAKRDVPLDSWIRARASRDPATVSLTILGPDKRPIDTQTWTGRIASYQPPELDSNSDSGTPMVTFEIAVEVPA